MNLSKKPALSFIVCGAAIAAIAYVNSGFEASPSQLWLNSHRLTAPQIRSYNAFLSEYNLNIESRAEYLYRGVVFASN